MLYYGFVKKNSGSMIGKSANIGEKKFLFRDLLKKAKGDIYFASLKGLETKRYEYYSLSALNLIKLKNLFKASNKRNLFILFLERSDFSMRFFPPYHYSSLVLQSSLDSKYTGPLFLLLFLEINPIKYGKTLGGELNLCRKLIKAGIRAGFYNFKLNVKDLDRKKEKLLKDKIKRFLDYLDTRTEKKQIQFRNKNTKKQSLCLLD